jgi:hypothetical protein
MIRTEIELYVHNLAELHRIIATLSKINGTKSVVRIETNSDNQDD